MNPYQQWCVRSNLKTIRDGEMTLEDILATLRANGYPSTAAAVEAITKEPGWEHHADLKSR